MNASKAARAIVITSLIALAAAAPPPQVRVAPRAMQSTNRPQADWQTPPAGGQFTALKFTVITGDDDLRGDSAAWIDLTFADGTKQKCLLKDHAGDSWPNNSTHDNDIPQCKLQQARAFDDLKKADIVLVYDGTNSAGPFETPDNWNVDEVRVNAQDFVQHSYPCLIDVSGHPLVRMKLSPPGPDNYPYKEGGNDSFDLSQSPSTC